MALSRYAELFLSESREHVSTINDLLLTLEREGDLGVVEEIFRAAHTLKGMSAAMECRTAAELAHALEHLLDQLRRARRPVDAEVADALFTATDALEQSILYEVTGEGGAVDAAPLLARLVALAGPDAEEEPEPAEPPAVALEAETEVADGLRVTVVIQATASLPAVRALLVLRRAAELGAVHGVEPDEERLHAGDFAGSLSFRLRGASDPDAVREALLGAGEVAHVTVESPAGGAEEAGDPAQVARRILGRTGDPFVRIAQGRLDQLVNQLGELVVGRDRLRRLAASRDDEELEELTGQLSRLISELRDEVMDLRMLPVGEVFDRFPRFVRDAARALGKRVDFGMLGRDVRLDRSLHAELSDLLVHLLRNALDHGLESPEERQAAGKPEAGRLRLVATRERSQVVMRVEDDGRGIQRERVRAAAVERGLFTAEEAEALGDDELHHLLTRAGFSTAVQVTDVSGRGVGLDVVASRVRALGGSLGIESTPGEGTTFTLRLPLSLAILRTLVVEVAGERYVLPISSVVQVAERTARRLPTVRRRGRIRHRGQSIPLLDLGALLHEAPEVRRSGYVPVIVVDAGAGPFALLADALHGQHEAVLKPFDATREMTAAFAGATLLPDGSPALILDVGRLAEWVVRAAEAEAR